jgi:hypothetical protein
MQQPANMDYWIMYRDAQAASQRIGDKLVVRLGRDFHIGYPNNVSHNSFLVVSAPGSLM